MARHRDHLRLQRADREGVAIGEQLIELRPIDREVFAQVEDRAKRFLHAADAFPNCQARAGPTRLQPMACTEVIRVRMGLEDPLHVKAMRGDMIEQGLRGASGGTA